MAAGQGAGRAGSRVAERGPGRVGSTVAEQGVGSRVAGQGAGRVAQGEVQRGEGAAASKAVGMAVEAVVALAHTSLLRCTLRPRREGCTRLGSQHCRFLVQCRMQRRAPASWRTGTGRCRSRASTPPPTPVRTPRTLSQIAGADSVLRESMPTHTRLGPLRKTYTPCSRAPREGPRPAGSCTHLVESCTRAGRNRRLRNRSPRPRRPRRSHRRTCPLRNCRTQRALSAA